ncbi:glycosyl hydrolase 53 family protein [Alicyclobacillus cellulosilyticus]|nr:glycosyl hydrolase 53 family protein [Alicyclobacillus cellulosilyticus]
MRRRMWIRPRHRRMRRATHWLRTTAGSLAALGALAGATAAPAVHAQPAQKPGLPPGLDVAIGRPVTVGGTVRRDPSDVSSVDDGDASTVWQPGAAKVSVTVDLQAPQRVSGCGVTWAGAAAGARFSVTVSTDGKTWHALPGLAGQGTPVAGIIQYADCPQPGVQARYVRLSVWTAKGRIPGIAEFRVFSPSAQAASAMMLGDDLSTMAQEEAIGTKYSADGKTQPLLAILKAGGTNYVRLRLWVNPPGGNNNLTQDLKMAREIKTYGMRLFLDIHYSDFWADPGKQNIPAAWRGQSLPALAKTVKSYTQSVMEAFAKQGTPVDMVSIGNEITDGILWPVGQLNLPDGTQQWSQLAALLNAGIAGARAGNPKGHPLKVMLHIDRGGDNAGAEWFFDNIMQAGVKGFDVIGLSYYPWFHGTLAAFRDNIRALAQRYHKPIVVAETQYPWTTANADGTPNQVDATTPLLPGYPATPDGQASFVRDIVSLVAALPNHLGLGVFYWEPAWLPGVGWEPGAGTSADNLTEFDWQGRALPAVDAYQIGPATRSGS